MKVFVGGRIYDSRRDVIGIVLAEGDKERIANMAPDATIYCEFVPTGKGTEPGLREFSPACVEKLLDRIKERASETHGESTVDWISETTESHPTKE